MAPDPELAERLRGLLTGTAGVTERKMFGGIAFLIRGNLAIAASGRGGLLVRVDPAESERLVATTQARPVVMRGRSLAGWLRVSREALRTRRALGRWAGLGVAFARALPPKRQARSVSRRRRLRTGDRPEGGRPPKPDRDYRSRKA